MKLLFLSATILIINDSTGIKPEFITGKWMSDNNDVAVEVFRENDSFAARLIWFDCSKPGDQKMIEHFDTENPDPKLRNRPWLGMVTVKDLQFDGKNQWVGGTIYDPNSGRTYRASIRMSAPNRLIVRGYWGIELFGESLNFKKLEETSGNILK